MDNVDQEYAHEKGIKVHNTPEASTIAVAECAFTLMIGITNHIGRADSSMRDGRWIKKELKRLNCNVPLVADIHYTPNAAEIAAKIVEKVRINPGNYADKKNFEDIEYTDQSYQQELDRIRQN